MVFQTGIGAIGRVDELIDLFLKFRERLPGFTAGLFCKRGNLLFGFLKFLLRGSKIAVDDGGLGRVETVSYAVFSNTGAKPVNLFFQSGRFFRYLNPSSPKEIIDVRRRPTSREIACRKECRGD